MKATKRIVLGVCGSIAAYKACDIARRLMEHGMRVDVAMTDEATRLVSPTTFAALTGNPVYANMWDTNAWHMAHIDLAKHADMILIAPATANMLAKLANGLADDCISTLVLASKAPVIIAPAMNDVMLSKRVVKSNIEDLKADGVKFISPVKGKLACGDVGVGHLAEVDDIVKSVVRFL